MASNDEDLVSGRSCQDCTLCCKLLFVEVLEKPRAVWCPHCDQKRGCKIYANRPEPCQSFYCGYRRIADLDGRWKPAKAKFLINYESAVNRIAIHADPTRPDAWRMEPFYTTIRKWAANALRENGTVVVWCGPHVIVVLPDRERDLGTPREDQFIVRVERPGPRGMEIDFELAEADDPRVTA